MPPIPRSAIDGECCHVLNRNEVFGKDGEHEAFLKAMARACIEVPMPVLGYCLMPNHFHLVVRNRCPDDLTRGARP